jgi:lipase ATG15
MQLPTSLVNLALSILSTFLPSEVSQHHPHARPPSNNNALSFHLRHMHAATSSARIYFADVPPSGPSAASPASDLTSPPMSIRTSRMRTARPPSFAEVTRARHMSMRGQSAALDWEEDEVLGPDVTLRETLLLLAKMTSDAYFVPGTGGWYNLTEEWDVVRLAFFWFVKAELTTSGCRACAGRVGAGRRRLPWVCLCDGRQ